MLSRIEEHLFLSATVQNACIRLMETKIGRVLSLMSSPIDECWREPSIDYRFIFMLDDQSQDILENGLLEKALEIIEDATSNGINIVVHCQYGISRSPTVVIAYLMRKHKWNVSEALDYVKKRRPIISPSLGFLQQLDIFEKLGFRADPETLRKSKLFKEYKCLSNNPAKKVNIKKDEYSLDESLNYSNNGKRYSCKKCRQDLFFDFNILIHPFHNPSTDYYNESQLNDNKTLQKCNFVYLVTPMNWMVLTENSGKITCPKCQEKIGHYIWSGKECVYEKDGTHCGTFITPWIHIQSAKVDLFELKAVSKKEGTKNKEMITSSF